MYLRGLLESASEDSVFDARHVWVVSDDTLLSTAVLLSHDF